MKLIGFNTEPKDIWEDNDFNVFRIEGMTAKEWVKAAEPGKQRQYSEFWEKRDKIVKDNFDKIWKNSVNPSGFPIEQELKMFQVGNPESLKQMMNALPQWEKLENITKTNGLAIGFDLETVGRAGEKNFSITEFALGVRQYQDGTKVKTLGESFALGIKSKSESDNFIREAIRKVKTEGWESLNDTERFSLERASMYGHSDYHNVFGMSDKIDFLDNQKFITVKKLGDPTRNIDTILKGLENLNQVNTNMEKETPGIFEKLINYIQADKDQESILFGANSEFDIAGLEHVAKEKGISFNGSEMRKNIVDIIYGARTVAATEGISVESYNQKYYKKRLGADVDSQLEVYNMQSRQTHMGIQDLYNELNLLEQKNVRGNKSYASIVIDSMKKLNNKYVPSSIIRDYGKDALFLVNRGSSLNKSKVDVAKVGEDTTQSYTTSNEYWKIDEAHTGYMEIDGEQKYILSMVNPLDKNIKFSIEKDSMEDAVRHIQNNTTWVKSDQITRAQLKEQLSYKYQDMGRRQFDKLISPVSVAKSGMEDKYGFYELEKYIKFNNNLNQWLKANPDKKLSYNSNGVKVLDEFIKETYTGKNKPFLKGYYQKQAFIGMKEKLDSEDKLIQDIITIVKESDAGRKGNNLVNTSLFKQSYDEILKAINDTHSPMSKKPANFTISDAFGIDIQLPDGSINRVNAQKTHVAISETSRIFSKMTIEEASASLKNLAERKVITPEAAAKFASQLSDTESNYGVYSDLGYLFNEQVDKYNNAKNPIKEFKEGYETNPVQTILRPGFQSTKEKNVTRFRGSVGDKRRSYTINEMYTDPEYKKATILNNVSEVTHSKIKNVPELKFIGNDITSNNGIIEATRELAESLNIPVTDPTDSSGKLSGEHQLLVDMFTAKEYKSDNYKGYAIGGAKDKGLKTFIVKPAEEGTSAFLLMTDSKHMNKLAEKILENDFDFSSRRNLIDSGIEEHAAIFEIPYINKHELEKATDGVSEVIGSSDFTLASIKQSSTFEKFLMPQLNVRMGKSGKIESYMNNGIYDYISSYRQGGKAAIENVLAGNFHEASRVLRKIQNEKFKEMSASSSYRNRDMGNGRIERITNYNVNDYLHAYEVEMQEGLGNLFKEIAANPEAKSYHTARNTIDAFASSIDKHPGKNETVQAYTNRIMETNEFKEFFAKRIFHSIGDDGNIKDYLKETENALGFTANELNKSLFDIIRDSVYDDINNNVFGGDTFKIISNIDKVKDKVNQILPESSTKKGIISFRMPGDFNLNAGLYSTMRPVYGQQNNAMQFSPDMLTVNGGASDIYNKAPIITEVEDVVKSALGEKYDPFGDKGYAEQERLFMARYKQMSDYELQLKYAKMESESASIAKKLGIEQEVFDKGLEYMRKDLLSLNEGKLFHSPELQAQKLFTEIEGEKIEFDVDNLNKTDTKKILNDLINKEIQYGDVIGKTTRGDFIYHEGSTAILTKENVEDLLSDDGITRTMPIEAQIKDVKLILNGAEKGTSHSIDIDNFVKLTGIDKSEAFDVADKLFKYLSDGAAVIGNLSIFKHANNMATDTIANTIFTKYVAAGKGEVLKNQLNAFIDDDKKANNIFEGVSGFEYKNNKLIIKGDFINPVQAYDVLLEKIKDNTIGEDGINEKIIRDLDYMNKHNISYNRIQRQPQNEHMAKNMRLDQRIEQTIRNRSQVPDNYFIDNAETREKLTKLNIENADTVLIADGIVDGVNGRVEVKTKSDGSPLHIGHSWDDLYIDDMIEDARNFNGEVKSLLKQDGSASLSNISEAVNYVSHQKISKRLDRNKKSKTLEKSIRGIVESVMYSFDNAKGEKQNIVDIDLESIKKFSKNKNIGAEDLINTLFYKEGKPSEILTKIADQQDIDLNRANSLRFNLNGLSFTHKGREYKDVLIPMQNITVINNDTSLFQEQQNATRKFLRGYMELLNSPGNFGNVSEELGNKYNTYMKDLSKQINLLSKDSDAYKAFNSVILPNSSGYLAQDEIPALVADMMDADMQKYISERDTIEARLANGEGLKDDVENLDKAYKDIDNKLLQISNQIKDPNNKPMEFVPLKKTKFADITTVNIDGKEYYGYVAALNKKGFQAAGVDFGVSGLQLIDDLEKGNPTFAGISKINYGSHKKDIVKKLNALEIKNLNIDESKDLVPQLDAFFGKYHKDEFKINTKTLNKAIENKEVKKIFGAFEGVAEEYLEKEGVHGILQRYPAFSSQPMAKFVYDRTMDGSGLQMRLFSPLSSAFTNVDFDGDNLFGALRLNGLGFFRKNSDQYIYADNAYKSGVKIFNEALSEIILDGDALKRDNVNFKRHQTANILETFRTKEYNEAVYQFAQNQGYDVENLTKAQKFAANQSDEVNNAFYRANLNTLKDEQVIIASTTPAMRKINIGSVSTPNFKLRDVINTMINKKDIDDSLRADMVKWKNSLTNMRTKSGGLLSITEQKGIDVKHLVDAMNTAQTTRWAMGLSKLYSDSEKSVTTNVSAMKDLLSASNSALFKTSEAEINEMANTIANTGFSQFEEQIAKSVNPKEVERLKTLMSFRALIEFQNIKGFDKEWGKSLLKGSYEESMYTFFKEYFQKYDNLEYTEELRGTVLQGLTKRLKDYTSGEAIKLKKGNLYFNTGTIEGRAHDTAFIYKGKGQFANFNLETNQIGDIAFSLTGSPEEINAKFKKTFNSEINVKVRDFIQDESLRKTVLNNLSNDRFENMLNEMIFDKGQVRKELNPTYLNIKHASEGFDALKPSILGEQHWADLEKLFIGKNKDSEKILTNMNNYLKAYEAYRAKTNSGLPGADLIREMNANIKADKKLGVQVSTTIDEIFKERLLKNDAFGSSHIMNRYLTSLKELDGFESFGEYNNSVKLLNEDLYDILREERKLSESFEKRQLDLNALLKIRDELHQEKHSEFDTKIEPLKEILNNQAKQQQSIISELKKSNKKTINEAETKVYSLFKDQKQIEGFLGLKKPTHESLVGFGQYLGKSFDTLSKEDISQIKENGRIIQREMQQITDTAITSSKDFKIKYHAVSKTVESLENYTPRMNHEVSAMRFTRSSDKVGSIIGENLKKTENIFVEINDLTHTARRTAQNKATKKELGKSIFESAKELDMKKLKGVGMVIGAMAALGIANNLLHGQRNDSPLKPERKKDGNKKPDTTQSYIDGPQAQYKQEQLRQLKQQERMLKQELTGYGIGDQAPGSMAGMDTAMAPPSAPMRRTIYHDKQSGLNFKVTAKTNSRISDDNNAKLISMAGGGDATVYSQSDTSGVTDNWLANKFAELI